MRNNWDQTNMTNTNSNKNKTQVLDKTAGTVEAVISSMTKEQWNAFLSRCNWPWEVPVTGNQVEKSKARGLIGIGHHWYSPAGRY